MNNKETKLLNVEFHKAISGCLEYKITIGEQVFEDSFSDVFDPILDLKSWLEAISVGVEQTSFSYDNEGQEFKFDFQRVTWDKEIFVISELYAPKHIFMNAVVSRKQLVKSFYIGLLTFANSEKYKPEEWESPYDGTKLSEFQSNIIEKFIEYRN